MPLAQKFPNADPLALRLSERLLAFDPKDRPTAEETLADPYFKGLAKVESNILPKQQQTMSNCYKIKDTSVEESNLNIFKENNFEAKNVILGDRVPFIYVYYYNNHKPQKLLCCTPNGTSLVLMLKPFCCRSNQTPISHLFHCRHCHSSLSR